MRRLKLTLAAIKAHCRPPSPGETTSSGSPLREIVYWDSQDVGFGLRVRPPKPNGGLNASFIVQRDLGGKPVKVTIGKLGPWTPELARKRARELAVEIDRGQNPNVEKRRARSPKITLADALELHIQNMQAKNLSTVSIKSVANQTRRYLGDWLTRPLVEISGMDCRTRHRNLSTKTGPYLANHVLRHFRACWNTAARIHEELPGRNPTRAVTFNKESPRNNPIPWESLTAWWDEVHTMDNHVRRDLQLFYLFTGLRRNDGKSIRWEHVDLDAGTIHRPKPKGGEDRAFTVPVSSFVLQILRRRRRENPMICPLGDGGFVFPGRPIGGEATHVSEAREQRWDENGKKLPSMPSPHRLRHTFATAGHEAYLRELDLKILMNHAQPRGDVTHGYIRVSVDHLRDCTEKITEFLLSKATREGRQSRN